jgi:hypothetical protein
MIYKAGAIVAEQENNEITLTLHGLNLTDGNVLARVFLAEFKRLLDALGSADKVLNQTVAHDYVIVDLKASSAIATLRETRRIGKRPRKAIRAELLGQRRGSPVTYFRQAITSIYNGELDTKKFPPQLIKDVAEIAKDSGNTFAHGTLAFGQENIVRIDDYLARQAQRAIERSAPEVTERPKYHIGLGYTSFDGVLKEIDTRGSLFRGKLILTAGGKEIDCVFREEDIPQVKQQFHLRARIEGMAHYDGESPLPERLDIKLITPIGDGDLTKWRGAFEPHSVHDEDNL